MTARLAALVVVLLVAIPPARVFAAQADAAGTTRHAAARAVLKDVLAQPAFERNRNRSWQRILRERIREWFVQLLQRALTPVLGRRSIAQVTAWVVSIAAVIVLLVWLTRVAFQRRAERPIGLAGDGPVAAPPGSVLGQEAAALIRAGRVREGARVAYRAAIRRLEEDGALRPDPARTPREQLRQLTPSHRRAGPLASMTAMFEAIWYAARPAGADEGAHLLRLLGELECLPSERAK